VPERVEPAMNEAAGAPEAEIHDDRTPTTLTNHTVLIGYGRVGTVVADGLKRQGTPFVLIEDSEKRIATAHAAGVEVVVGNAATSRSLALANIEGASVLIVAIPNAFEAGQAVEQSRKLNPNLTIIARAHSDEEVSYLRDLGANEVIMGEREIGLGMLGWTNGENAHELETVRTQANLDAAAAALKLHDLPPTPPPKPEPAPVPRAEPPPPAIPVEELEAAIESAHPQHIPEGPAEPPELVPAFGEMPVEEDVDEEPAAFVVAGEMAPHEPLTETPVNFFVPEPKEQPVIEPEPQLWAEEALPELQPELPLEPEAEVWPEPEPEPEPELELEPEAAPPPPAPEPEIAPVAVVEEELDYIDIEPDPVAPEPEAPRAAKAGAPASAPGVPYKPEVEPAAE
jgi:CPA2 family monovalent cation:H+ antiporter-2